jgi:hypothetical protein
MLSAWSKVLDPDGEPEWADEVAVRPLVEAFPAESPRESLRARFSSSTGFVMTSDTGVTMSLREGHLRRCHDREKVQADIAEMEATNQRPCGEYFEAPVALWRAKMQMSLGWYYYWEWDNEQPDWDWIDAKNDWAKQAYWYLFRHARKGCDTPGLLLQWIQDMGVGGRLGEAAQAWLRARVRPGPRTVAKVVRPAVIKSLVWLASDWYDRLPGRSEGVLYWYESEAVADELEKYMHVVRAGQEPRLDPFGDQALSITAHGKGLNLQRYQRNVILEPMASAEAWEQLLWRTHRGGQQADEVYYLVVQHTAVFRQALEKARERAKKIGKLSGQMQRLVYADLMEGE